MHSLLQVTLNIKIYCTWYVFRVKISSRLLLTRTRKLFPGFMMSRSRTFVSFFIPMLNPPSTCRNSNLCSPPNTGAGVAPRSHVRFLSTLVGPSKQTPAGHTTFTRENVGTFSARDVGRRLKSRLNLSTYLSPDENSHRSNFQIQWKAALFYYRHSEILLGSL